MTSGLSRGNKAIPKNGIVRRSVKIAALWSVRSQASEGLGYNVASIDSSGGLSLSATNVTTSGKLFPFANGLSIGRQDGANLHFSAGAGFYSGVAINSGNSYMWSSSSTTPITAIVSGSINGSIGCESSGVIKIGVDAATVVNQTFKACNGVGTDKAGANLTLAAGIPTGAGTEGNLLFQTAATAGTSATLGTLVTRLTVNSVTVASTVPVKPPSLTVAQATSALAAACGAGALIWVSNEAGGACPAMSNGTDWKKIALGATIA